MSTTILNGIFPWMLRRGIRLQDNSVATSVPLAPGAAQRWYRVKVDMDRLRSHLAPESRQKTDEQSLRRWLKQSGFEPRGEWWVVQESALGQLAPSEVAEFEPIEA